MNETRPTWAIRGGDCIRCAACATVAPGNFAVAAGPARVLRPPATPAETTACESARALCPTQAIVRLQESAVIEAPSGPDDPLLYPQLLDAAEAVRWRATEPPWSAFDASKVTPPLVEIVHEMAFSEQKTFSATQKFLQAFADDPDFTQWIAVWFYEETRHPSVLVRWLQLAQRALEPDFVQRGRVSTPFMKSLTGTLVTNVISEVVAASMYRNLWEVSPEPLLGALGKRIAADEARHAASFFAYARRAIARSPSPERERLDALKVLHFWLSEAGNVTHPVNQSLAKFRQMGESAQLGLTFAAPTERICQVIGLLVGLPLRNAEDAAAALNAQTAKVHASAAGARTAPSRG